MIEEKWDLWLLGFYRYKIILLSGLLLLVQQPASNSIHNLKIFVLCIADVFVLSLHMYIMELWMFELDN